MTLFLFPAARLPPRVERASPFGSTRRIPATSRFILFSRAAPAKAIFSSLVPALISTTARPAAVRPARGVEGGPPSTGPRAFAPERYRGSGDCLTRSATAAKRGHELTRY